MNIEKRFMEKVSKQPDGCWLWTAAIVKAVGYGRFGMKSYEVDYAHRASWRLFRGDLPKGMYVCHKCDVRSCVNPDHLFLGSHRQNMRDAADKGRVRIPRQSYASDETHQVAKLTNEQVLEIRATEPWKRGDRGSFAKRFGVCPATIWNARTGRSFKDLPCA